MDMYDFYETYRGPKGYAAIAKCVTGAWRVYHHTQRPVSTRDYAEGLRATLAEAQKFAKQLTGQEAK